MRGGLRALHLSEKDPEYVAKIAEGDAIGQKDIPKAISCYERAFEIDPDNPDPLVRVFDLQRATTRNVDELPKYADRLVSLFPKHAMSHAVRGKALSAANRHADAVDSFSASIRLDPNLAKAYMGSGFSLIALGRHEEAERMYRRAVELCPDDGNAVFYHCSELEELGRYEDALAVLEAYLPLTRRFDVYRHLGRIHGLLGNTKKSFENYLKSVSLHKPNRGDGHTRRVERRYREITWVRKKLSRLDPADPESFALAGMILLGVEWRDTGIDMLRTAVHLAPRPFYCDAIATTYIQYLQHHEAIEYLERAVGMPEHSRKDLAARYLKLITYLFQCGRRREMVKWYKKARSLGISNRKMRKYYDAVMEDGPDIIDVDQVAGGWTTKNFP